MSQKESSTSISHNIKTLLKTIEKIKKENSISYPIQILVATKYANASQIKVLTKEGLQLLGENKLQDALDKQSHLKDKTIEWHFIGHLQRNKAKKAIDHFSCIQSIDSLRLLEKCNDLCKELNKKQDIFLQINIANDPNKFGFSSKSLLKNENIIFSFSNLKIRGIMIVVPIETEDKTRVHYKKARQLYEQLQSRHQHISTLSMGMSQDYTIGIEEGSNMIRIGRMLFK